VTGTKKITIMIVDDEELARTRIRQLVQKDPDLEIISECSNGTLALEALPVKKPDVLLLDIQMPGLDGFGVLKKLNAASIPLIIFVTAFDEFAVRAFDLNACDYLLKPFKAKRFEEAMLRAKNALRNRDQKQWLERTSSLLESLAGNSRFLENFAIKDRGRILFVKSPEVDWIEAQDNYVRLHCGKETYLIRQKIGALQQELNPARFARVHRGAIVNVERIRELQQWFHRDYRIVLRDGTVVPLGRSYREGLRRVLGSSF
jgi:two-component system LytT family response regulator